MDNITTITEMLSEQIQEELATDYTMSDLEQVTRRLVQEIGRQAIAQVVNAEENRYPESVLCQGCESDMLYISRRSAQLRTLFGCMQVERAYYLCPEYHQGCCPLDQRLGLRPNAISAEPGTARSNDGGSVAIR